MTRTVLGIAAVFVVYTVLNFVIHGILLKPAYTQYQQLLRTPEDSSHYMMYMMAAFLIFAAGLVLAYGKLTAGGNWMMNGLGAGILVWLISSVSRYLIYYSIEPWPLSIVLRQIGYELPMCLLVGITAGAILKK